VLARINNNSQIEIETDEQKFKSEVDKILNNGLMPMNLLMPKRWVKRQISFSPAAKAGELKIVNR